MTRLAVAILALALPAAAQTFAPATHHEMGPGASGLAITDLDGDGLLDVATANSIEVKASVRLGDGAGGLRAETSWPLPGLTEAIDLAAGDITGDGLLDLVVSGNTGNGSALVVLRAVGDGTYSPVTFPFPCCTPHLGHLQLADFHGDGGLDVAGGTVYGSSLLVAKNDAAALLPSAKLSSVVTPCQDTLCIEAVGGVGAADLDEDGDVDLACTNPIEQTLVVFANSGDGLFSQVGHEDLRVQPTILLLRDVDEDGHVDALAAEAQGVQFLAGDGTGGFADPVGSPVSGGAPPFITGPTALALADVTGDGRLDVAATQSVDSQHQVLVVPGDGAGSFGPILPMGPIAKLSPRLRAADLDRDGRPDLVATEPGTSLPPGSTIALLLNTTKPAVPWNDTGFQLAGTLGAPWLMTFGPLTAGSTLELSLNAAPPGAPAVLVLGLSELYARFKGGTLVPHPDIVLGPFAVEADGGLPLAGRWPAGVPSGTLVGFQWWIVDAGAPQGLASSNGVLGLTP